MLRFGTISDRDSDKGLFRVQFQDEDLVSYWLSPVQLATRSAKSFHPFAIGEHVACLLDPLTEDGVILGAIYSKADTAGGTDTTSFIDFFNKIAVEYDATAAALRINNGSVQIEVTSSQVSITKGPESLGGILGDLIDQMALETHTCAAPGSPTTPPLNAAAYTAIKTRLQQLLG